MDAIEDNKAFFTSTPAWHGLGKVLRDAPSLSDAWKLAYPHELYKLPLSAYVVDSEGNRHYSDMTTRQAIVRDDGREIGHVGVDYCLEQPYEIMEETFAPFIDSGEIELEAGGSLKDGAVMWCLGKIKSADADIVSGDQVSGYLLTCTSFDGSLARRIQFTPTRVVCWNTLSAAIGGAEKARTFKTKHTKNMKERVSNALLQINMAKQDFSSSVEVYKDLARTKMGDAAQEQYFKDVIIGQNVDQAKASEKLKAKVRYVIDTRDARREVEMIPAMRGTAWEGYNAVTRYLTHDYGRNQDTRLAGQWYGGSKKVNDMALQRAILG